MSGRLSAGCRFIREIEYCILIVVDSDSYTKGFARFSCILKVDWRILNTPSFEFLRKMIPSLLQGMKSILSTNAIAHILNVETASMQEILTGLEKDDVICRKREHHVDGWTAVCETVHDTEKPAIEKWLERLSEYVLFHPGATLPEIMMILEDGNPSAQDRTILLAGAIQQAQENGEFRLLSYFISEIMRPSGTSLTVLEAGEVLAVFEPRKLRHINSDAAIEFVKQHLPSFETAGDRAMALTRLGELELLENRIPQAEKYLKEALELCMKENTGDWIPAILSSMAEIPRDFDGIAKMAAAISEVIDWLPQINDNDIEARILATAASALADLKMNPAAEEAILSAMTHIPVVTLETQLVLEWCRAKVFIASGRKKAAMTMLQRALLLAERANDQLAVMEILNTIVLEMKERPGYTVRSLISIMQSVMKRASTNGNISNRLYALDHIVDMYTRTLQVARAMKAAEMVSEIVGSSDMLSEEPLSLWCKAYLGFLAGDGRSISRGDLLLPGTDCFLKSLAMGSEPEREAGMISDHLMASPGSSSVIYALILAMEAYTRGFYKASSTIAAALDSSYSSFHEKPFLSWELCISGILASKDRHADDFFQSAQILARQLDRLLLVWLLLRCRMKLSPGRSFREDSEMSLMLAELDEYVALQLPGEARNEFMERTGADQRLEKLSISSGCPAGTLREQRDSLAEKVEDESMDSFREISKMSCRIFSRSEISASLETLGILSKADRVLALSIKGSSISIIEGHGPGRWRLPCMEVEERIKELPREMISIDNFGENPFGSRRYLLVPSRNSVIPAKMERRMHSLSPQRGNYLLIEMDTPFDCAGKTVEFFVDCLCRQVDSALLLRDRESMAYIDTLTGSVIGYSWTRRMLEAAEEVVSSDSPLSVLLVDVDGLREINRIFGYMVGDNTLKTVVSTIKGILRPNDMIGRLREDLFAVLLPETGGKNAIVIAQRICGVIAGTEIRPDRVPVTVCIGATVYRSSGENSELIISRAYAALNWGKNQGGNRAVLWSPEINQGDSNSEMLTIFNTGDPGWDHSISVTVMELLSSDGPSLELIAEKFRDALRSEFIYLEDGKGNSFGIGSRIFRRIPEDIQRSSGNRIHTHSGILGRYDALSVRLACGGRLISIWDNTRGISGSLKNTFRALSTLSSLLIESGSAISRHPHEERP